MGKSKKGNKGASKAWTIAGSVLGGAGLASIAGIAGYHALKALTKTSSPVNGDDDDYHKANWTDERPYNDTYYMGENEGPNSWAMSRKILRHTLHEDS